jgi:hypothetical protein
VLAHVGGDLAAHPGCERPSIHDRGHRR